MYGYPEWHQIYGQPKPKPRLKYNSGKKAAQASINVPSSINLDTDNVTLETYFIAFTETQCQQISIIIQASRK